MEAFIYRNRDIQFWKIGKDIAERYYQIMIKEGNSYLGEKTKSTIQKWMKEGEEISTFGITAVASYAINDYHNYVKKGGLNNIQFVNIKMNESFDLESILRTLEKILEPVIN